jgi:hypothetical protein
MQVGHDLRVAVGIINPHCAVCGEVLASLAGAIEKSEMPTMEPVNCDLNEVALDEVDEWFRCRDGIDKAEISLKGFCDEIGADMTKSRISDLCRELQDMLHTHYGLGD